MITHLKGICEDLCSSLIGPFGKANKELSSWGEEKNKTKNNH